MILSRFPVILRLLVLLVLYKINNLQTVTTLYGYESRPAHHRHACLCHSVALKYLGVPGGQSQLPYGARVFLGGRTAP